MKIAELKEAVRLEDVLLHYQAEVEYRGWNTWVSMKCCFHDDREASASVNLSEDRFKCHACDVSGDILDIVMYAENCDLNEARQFIIDNFVQSS